MARVFHRLPSKGINTSLPEENLPDELAVDALNVRFRYDEIVGRFGTTSLGTQAAAALHFARFYTDNSGANVNHTMMITNTGLFRLVGTTWTAVTGVPAGSGRYGVAIGEGDFYFTRQAADKIYFWDGVAGAFANLTDSSGDFAPAPAGDVYGARYLEYFNNRLLAGYTRIAGADQSTRVQFSVNGNTGNWDTVTGGGFLDLTTSALGDEQAEPLTGLRSLTSRCAAYRRHSIVDIIPTGILTPVFDTEVRIRGVGCAAPYTLASVGHFHIFLGEDNVYMWDGIRLTPIGDPILRTLRSLIDPAQINNYFAGISTAMQEYYLYIAPTAFGGQVFVYDYKRDTWTPDQYPNTTLISISALNEADIGVPTYTWLTVPGNWDDYPSIDTWELFALGSKAVLFGGGPLSGTFGSFYSDDIGLNDYTGDPINHLVQTAWKYPGEDGDVEFFYAVVRAMLRVGNGTSSDTTVTFVGRSRDDTVFSDDTKAIGPNDYFAYFDFIGSGIGYSFVIADSGGVIRWRSLSIELTKQGQATS